MARGGRVAEELGKKSGSEGKPGQKPGGTGVAEVGAVETGPEAVEWSRESQKEPEDREGRAGRQQGRGDREAEKQRCGAGGESRESSWTQERTRKLGGSRGKSWEKQRIQGLEDRLGELARKLGGKSEG